MKKLLTISACILLSILGCKKETAKIGPDPTPTTQSCFANSDLEGTWTSDSVRYVLVDSNNVILYDSSYAASLSSARYIKIHFTCSGTTRLYAMDEYEDDSLINTTDSPVPIEFNGTTMYAVANPSDTIIDSMGGEKTSVHDITPHSFVYKMNYYKGIFNDKQWEYMYFYMKK